MFPVDEGVAPPGFAPGQVFDLFRLRSLRRARLLARGCTPPTATARTPSHRSNAVGSPYRKRPETHQPRHRTTGRGLPCGEREVIAGKAGGEQIASEAAIARKRLAEALAIKAELANAQARGETVLASEIEAEWSGILRGVRAGILAAPSRVGARLPHLSVHDIAVVDEELRQVLTELGEDRAPAL
jgi:phage terminase Nu1 subunit (DNA packaging protein)